ncbi:hypothetical protein KIPE111705_34400 [Kibdelosporangium persicum]|uniref:Uncharacterized protein n=1 Tax=Kibdelosporangium persicum TaxID=2698649 RepID=A0ABX2FGC5_9PSEU|nr:hypothetical protein [Kibdelosporangium persicum]NRN69920.1 hypothetical protein [Kibdelosporangium persicum]
MNTEELKAALRGATVELEPRPTLTADVMRGGVRRQRVRRITVAATTLVAVAAVSTTASAGWQFLSEPTQVATDPRMTKPTRGDLAQDAAFLEEVIEAWEDKPREPVDKVVTKPHVYWAGTTPAGRAAVVMQETATHETVRGLVGISQRSGELELLILDEPMPREGKDKAYKFGPEDRVVLALEGEQPQFVSDKVTYDNPDGLADRDWRPMREADGVLLAELPPGTGPMDGNVIAGDPNDGVTEDEIVDTYNADEARILALKHTYSGLDWGTAQGGVHLMWAQPGQPPAHWNDSPWLSERWQKALAKTDVIDPAQRHLSGSHTWYVSVAGTASQQYVISEHVTLHSGPTRLYAVTITAEGKHGEVYSLGPTQKGSPLPVLVTLPDKSGKLAVAKGATLSYRTTKDGAWLENVHEALRVPNDAVEIRVSYPGKEPAIVPAAR